MFDDVVNIFFIVLDIIFSELYDCEFILRFQMRSFDQIKDLHPVSILQRVFPQVFDKLNDQICLMDLLVNLLTNAPTLPLDKFVLWELVIEILHYFVDGLDDHLGVEIQERSVVAHLPPLLPVQ